MPKKYLYDFSKDDKRRYKKPSSTKKSTSTKKSNTTSTTSTNKTFTASPEKTLKKMPNIAKAIITLFFIIGLVSSFFVCKLICKNDCFEINGKKSYSLTVGSDYIDEGVKVIGFGADLNSKVNITVYKNGEQIEGLNQIDTSEEAVYQIVYTVSSIRFKDVKLIRTLTIVPEEIVEPETDAVS